MPRGIKKLCNEITEQIILDVIDKLSQGAFVVSLAKQYNVSEPKLRSVLKDRGVDMSIKNKVHTKKGYRKFELDYEFIYQSILDGRSASEMARLNNISVQTLLNQMRQIYGVQFGKKWTSDDDKKQIVSDYLDGSTLLMLSQKYNLCIKSIGRIIRKSNIKTRINYFRRIPEDKIDHFLDYSKKVRKLSVANRRVHKLSQKAGYHWHHLLTVADAFILNVPIEITASIYNQELILADENLKIGSKSTITKEKLLDNFLNSF